MKITIEKEHHKEKDGAELLAWESFTINVIPESDDDDSFFEQWIIDGMYIEKFMTMDFENNRKKLVLLL